MERFPYGDLKVFGGRSHPALTGEICRNLGREAGRVTLYNFSDGENYCQIEENVRGADVFVVQPTGPPANHNIMELLIMLDAFKRSSASRVTAVLPYYGYARLVLAILARVPITAKLVADLIVAAGADRMLCVDLHAAQIQGFFNIPVDHLFAAPVLLDAIRDANLDPLTVVSPDAGGVERARAFAKRLGAGPAIDRVNASPIERVFCTNTVPLDEKLARCPLVTPLSIAPLLAEAIQRIHQGASVSSLFV